MSWKETIENKQFKITTGDGREWQPQWLLGESSIEYNTTAYNFINLKGTLVDRKKPNSRKVPLSVWFQGEDNITQTDNFLKSAEDPRPWEVVHPILGTITGQPISITRNDGSLNATELKIDFWETIVVDYPDNEISVQDRITAKAIDVRAAGITSYTAVPTSADVLKLKTNTEQVKGPFLNLAGDKKIAYENAASATLKSADNLLSDKRTALRNQQELFTIPVDFEAGINSKVNAFKRAFRNLDSINSKNDKFFYESQGATALASLCECVVTVDEGEYPSRRNIEEVVTLIVELYGEYILTMDNALVDIYDVDNAWNPDANLQTELNDLVLDTISNLQTMAFEAKQERVIYLEKDSNLIVLTHRYLGLDENDENMETLRQLNNIKNHEVLLIRKGREIKFYA